MHWPKWEAEPCEVHCQECVIPWSDWPDKAYIQTPTTETCRVCWQGTRNSGELDSLHILFEGDDFTLYLIISMDTHKTQQRPRLCLSYFIHVKIQHQQWLMDQSVLIKTEFLHAIGIGNYGIIFLVKNIFTVFSLILVVLHCYRPILVLYTVNPQPKLVYNSVKQCKTTKINENTVKIFLTKKIMP